VDAAIDRDFTVWYSIAGFVKTSKPANKNRINATRTRNKIANKVAQNMPTSYHGTRV